MTVHSTNGNGAATSGPDPRTIGPRIRMMMPRLTPLEARVVETILARRGFDEGTPLRVVADEAGVSDAMIVKIAKKLGFDGYKDFRAGLADYNRLPTADLHEELSPDDTGAEIARKVFRTSVHALEETLAILDPDAVERAADLIFSARQRDLYGIGGSAQIARDVAHKLLRIGVRTSVFDDAHMMLMSAALLEEGDVAIAVSHSGATTAVIEPIEMARRRGAHTIALTNYATSPLASIADVVLCSTAQGSPLLGENAAARVAQLIIFDVVFAAVARRDLDLAQRNLAATMGAVTEKRRRP
jgi:DNA-binding MurR/RpiR family transcriptional regulator